MSKILRCFTVLFVLCLLAFSVLSVSAATYYMVGDVDNDNDVTVLDATIALRVSVGIMKDLDGMMTLRGDIDESGDLDPLDATVILRYNADIKTTYPVGEYRAYPTEEPTAAPTEAVTEAPTEAPTQAPTQAPTSNPDPYELPRI